MSDQAGIETEYQLDDDVTIKTLHRPASMREGVLIQFSTTQYGALYSDEEKLVESIDALVTPGNADGATESLERLLGELRDWKEKAEEERARQEYRVTTAQFGLDQIKGFVILLIAGLLLVGAAAGIKACQARLDRTMPSDRSELIDKIEEAEGYLATWRVTLETLEDEDEN